MKISQIINETTVSGSVASVPMPMGEVQKRVEVKKPKKKGKYMNSLSEGAVKQLAMDLKELSDAEFKKKYGKTKKEMQGTKEVKEADLHEDDVIIVPGHGMKRRTGFVPQGQSRVDHEVEMARSDVLATMKNAKAIYELLKNRSEDEGIEGWVQEKLIKANDYLNAVKEYYDEKMMQEMNGGVIAGGGVGESIDKSSVGYENAKAIAHAAKNRTPAKITLGGEPIKLEQNEVDFAYGIYKQAVRDGRVEDIVKVLGDPVKFDKMMAKIRSIMYRDRNKEEAEATADRLAGGLNENSDQGVLNVRKDLLPNFLKKLQISMKDLQNTPGVEFNDTGKYYVLKFDTSDPWSDTLAGSFDLYTKGKNWMEFQRKLAKTGGVIGVKPKGTQSISPAVNNKINQMWIDNDGSPHKAVVAKKEQGLSEKAVSKAQQKFMGMVHAAQKGKKPASKAVADVAKSMKKSDAKDFAKTKHKGLPEKVKKD